MKQSVLPEIPQQQLTGMNLQTSKTINNRSFHDISVHRQAQNPYQHLIRPYNNPSQVSHTINPKLTKLQENNYGKKDLSKQNEQAYQKKIMFMMHEQIQICLKFYSEKFNQQLKKQAIEIIKLKQILEQNSRQLCEKNNIIENLKMKLKEVINGSPSSSKKKISITSRTASKSPNKIQMPENPRKIQQIEQKLSNLRLHEHSILELQEKFAKKLNKIEISTISLLGSKLNKGKIRVNSFIQKGSIKIKQIEQYLLSINNQQRQQKNQIIKTQISCLKAEIQQLQRNCKSFKQKQFKYENYQIDELSNQIAQLNTKICVLEHRKYQIKSPSQILKDGSTLKYNFQQNLQPNANKNFGINPQQLSSQQALDKSKSKFTSSETQRQIKQGTSLGSLSKNIEIIKKRQLIRQDKVNINSKNAIFNYMHPKIEQNTGLSNSFSINQLQKKTMDDFYKSSRNFVNTSVLDNEKQQQQFSQNESVQDYTDSQYDTENEKYQQNRARLLGVLKNIQLPIQVEIDQTGYLKSVLSGMYLVDQEGNGFELQQSEILQLSNQGVIHVI